MIIESKDGIAEKRSKIYENAEKTYARIVQNIEKASSFELFADIKFNKFGVDPIEGTPLNFIEQLNQMFSDLVVLYALEELLDKYPDKQFEVNFGAKAGFDIKSTDGMVAAECFAVTSVDSNGKLREDAKKLIKLPAEVEKYIYFYSQNDTAERIGRVIGLYHSVTFVRIKDFAI